MGDIFPWQTELWHRLSGREQLAHAYLFSGPEGTGKRVLADSFVARLLCSDPQPEGACGRCKACHLLKVGTHPDYFLLTPEEPEKPIRIDQVRALVDFVSQTAQLGGRKVVLIEPAEAMNINAANALLKSLEEPSGQTILLLISHQASRLLPTIRSRCVQLTCPVPTRQQSLTWLQRQLPDASESELSMLLDLSGDSPLKALKLHTMGVEQLRANIVEDLKQLLKHQFSPAQVVERWNAASLSLLLDWFYDWTLAMLRYRMTQNEGDLGAADMAKVVQYLANKSDLDRIVALQQWILSQRQKVLSRANLNRTLLLEALLVRWLELPLAH